MKDPAQAYRGNNAHKKVGLPLRLTIVGAGKRSFRFLIHRHDGTVLEASSLSYSSETAARMAGLPAMRRRSEAARGREVARAN